MKNERYTIGQIYRKGLLKSHTGEPYKDKGTISKVLSGLEYEEKQTPWGPAKTYSIDQIKELNEKWSDF